MTNFVIDTENMSTIDVYTFNYVLDNSRIGVKVYALKFSDEENQIINARKVSRLKIPYHDILFVEYGQLSRAQMAMNAILDNLGRDVIVFTKDINLARLLKPKVTGVLLYG